MSQACLKRDLTYRGPGDVLLHRYLEPHKIKIAALAAAAGLSRKHLSDVVNGRVRVTAGVAVRLARALGTTPQFWLDLQNWDDLEIASERISADAVRPLLPVPGATCRPGAKRSPADAADRLLERRNRLPAGMNSTIREMIEFGRD